MGKAKIAFHAFDSEKTEFVHFEVGDKVPDHIPAGSHAVTGRTDEPEAARMDSVPGAARGAGTADEPPADPPEEPDGDPDEPGEGEGEGGEDSADLFDPGADGVKASDVHAYLSALDVSTEEGAVEFERVVEAEKAAHNDGQGRVTAFPKVDGPA